MEYKILCNNKPEELEKAVNEHIAAGWRPQGGVSIGLIPRDPKFDYDGPDIYYAQAMVK